MYIPDATRLVRRLMEQFRIDGDWRFKYDSCPQRFGFCNWTRKVISLSRKLVKVNDQAQVEDTIRHEIAHALVGPHVLHHGKEWKAMAAACGAIPVAKYDADVVAPVPHAWRGVCLNCSKVIYRHRKKRVACKDCCDKYTNGLFNLAFIYIWERTNETD